MNSTPYEPVTIVVSARDRFSTTATCLSNIFKNSQGYFSVIAVFGGMPAAIQRDLESKFADKVRFIFFPEMIGNAAARNIALREIKTRLTVFLDTDVFVKPGWLDALLDCEKETGAVLVTPLVLYRQNMIHTAGNDFYVFHEKGKAYAKMELRGKDQPAGMRRNLKRQEIDFAEVHCQMYETETAKKYGVFDENLREGHEMDGGLSLKRAGLKMMVEPKSVVYLYYPERIDCTDDLAIYKWKWEPKAMDAGFVYFEKKWGININYKRGFTYYLNESVYPRVGFFSRRSQTPWAVKTDLLLYSIKKKFQKTALYQFLFRVIFQS